MSRGNIPIFDTKDLDAIYSYVRAQRAHINEFQGLEAKISDFESWYQGLSWYQKEIMTNDTFDEAVRRRDEINKIMGVKLPPTWTPADAPQTSPPSPPLVPTGYKVALALGAGGLIGLILLEKSRML